MNVILTKCIKILDSACYGQHVYVKVYTFIKFYSGLPAVVTRIHYSKNNTA